MRPLKILLAEGDLVRRSSSEELLRRRGHEVLVVGTGPEALEVLSREIFDLVLMDVQMPEMDGLAAARAIRAGAVPNAPRDLRIVALTAHALQGDRERFLEAGMDDYFSKPIDGEALDRLLECGAAGRHVAGPPLGVGETEAHGLFEPVRDRLRDLLKRMPAVSVWGLVSMALEELQPGVERLSDAVERSDAEAVAREAHSLRGAWTTLFGPTRIVEIAGSLERLARREDLSESPALLEELRHEVPRLREFLNAERQRAV